MLIMRVNRGERKGIIGCNIFFGSNVCALIICALTEERKKRYTASGGAF